MIVVLGRRRIMILAVLAGICLLLSAFYLAILFPQVSESDRMLRGLRGDVSGMEEKTRSLRAAHEEFQANKADFDRIEQVGFFNTQDRMLIRERFQSMKKDAGILNAKYEMGPAKVVASPLVEDAGYRLLRSEMEISLEASDDVRLYAFLYALGNEFPGRVSFTDVSIMRMDKGLSNAIYAELASANPPVLVTATIKAEWYSLVALKDIAGLIEGVEALPEEEVAP